MFFSHLGALGVDLSALCGYRFFKHKEHKVHHKEHKGRGMEFNRTPSIIILNHLISETKILLCIPVGNAFNYWFKYFLFIRNITLFNLFTHEITYNPSEIFMSGV